MTQSAHALSSVPAQTSAAVAGRPGTPPLWELVNDLQDAMALADGDGIIVLATQRTAEMFGYQHADLTGLPVESLIPAELRAAHRRHRAAYARTPSPRLMGSAARLTGLRADGTTFPVEIGISPVTVTGGGFTLLAIRDISQALRLENLVRPLHHG